MSEIADKKTCAREVADSVEHFSLKRSAAFDALEKRGDDILDGFLAGYEDFRMCDARVQRAWAEDPSQYDEETHLDLDRIQAQWIGTTRMLMAVTRMAAKQNVNIDATKVRMVERHYRCMLSADVSDLLPMRDGLSIMVDEALDDEEAHD